MDVSLQAPTRHYCWPCRVERRFVFSGYATVTGAENTVRPRAIHRRCATCGYETLVLADVDDAASFVRNVVDEWRQGVATGSVSGLDLDDLSGLLTERIWLLYLAWDPAYGDGRITFRNYAAGILRRKLRGWVAEAVGGVRTHRNGHGRDALRYPKAHSLAVAESYDDLVAASTRDSDDSDAAKDRPRAGRLAFALGAFQRDFAGDRSLDLGRLLDDGDRRAPGDIEGSRLATDPGSPD